MVPTSPSIRIKILLQTHMIQTTEKEFSYIKRIFERNFSGPSSLNKALDTYGIGGFDESDIDSQKDNYRSYLKFFKESSDTKFIKYIYKKFNDYKYSKRKLTMFLPEIYERFE